MRKFIITFLLFIASLHVFAQDNLQDVVYLKNGSIIRGVIIEKIQDKLIKIETFGANVFVYQMDEIEKLTREPCRIHGNCSLNNAGSKSGFKGMIELGHQFGVGKFGMDRLKFNMIYRYQINPYFSAGIGTGLRFYFDDDAAVIPIFADLRMNFLNYQTSPYFSLDIGYANDATNSFKKVGLIFNPEFGVNFRISEKYAMNAGFGVEIQQMDYYYYYYSHAITNSSIENSVAVSFNLGFSF
jgi:hypothetical protein